MKKQVNYSKDIISEVQSLFAAEYHKANLYPPIRNDDYVPEIVEGKLEDAIDSISIALTNLEDLDDLTNGEIESVITCTEARIIMAMGKSLQALSWLQKWRNYLSEQNTPHVIYEDIPFTIQKQIENVGLGNAIQEYGTPLSGEEHDEAYLLWMGDRKTKLYVYKENNYYIVSKFN